MSYGQDMNSTDFSPIEVGQTPQDDEFDPANLLNWVQKSKAKEEQWRQRAKRIVRIYRDDSETDGATYTSNRPFSYTESPYNILWANIQTLTPALFSNMPKADVRNRFLSDDPIAKAAGSVIEKVLNYIMDAGKFDEAMRKVVFDYLGPGRGIIRIRTIPEIDKREISENIDDSEGEVELQVEEELVSQFVQPERVPWSKFIIDPVDCWDNVMRIGFEHQLTKDEFVEFFPDEKNSVAVSTHDINNFETEPRYEVYEIWDKRTKKVIYLGNSPKILKIQDDPFGFENFWPIYEPMISIKTNDTMVPVPEFTIYEPQAYELNRVSYRITDLVKSCKFHGIYDSSQNNMQDLLESADSTFVPDNGDNMKKNGIKNIIDFVDTSPIASVLGVLYQQRQEIRRIIDEITGIADILRGEGNPAETATASSLKASYAGLRLRDRKEMINKYVVGNIRMMAEMVAKFYPTKQLEEISGETITPEIENYIRNDILRNYRIDIETDSTVLASMEEQTNKRANVVTAVVDGIGKLAPMVQGGMIPLETAKALLNYALASSKLPQSLMDAIDMIGSPPKQLNAPSPSPEMGQEMTGQQEMIPEEMMGSPQITDQLQDMNL